MSQSVCMIIIVAMTLSSAITKTPMHKHFGVKGCYFFWAVSNIYLCDAIVGGFGIAVFRLVCFHFLFKKEINANQLMKNVLFYGKVTVFILFVVGTTEIILNGMETAILYQFCMDLGPVQAKVLHQYENHQKNHPIFSILRIGCVVIAQMMIIGELTIYLWLLYQLRLHDKERYQEGVIHSSRSP